MRECIVSILIIIMAVFVATKESSKRLLVDDPDVLAKVLHLEQTIQGLTGYITSLNNTLHRKITEQDGIIGSLKNNVSSLQSLSINQQTTIQQLSTSSQGGRGSTYIRWGRTQCSGMATQLIYAGYASGQKYYNGHDTYRGGPSNMLCLPDHPELGNATAGGNSYLYGTEYDDSEFGSNAPNQDVPCALCLNSNASTTVMIPGRKSCYNGWNKEYNGILASGSLVHTASVYICVDINPEYIPGGRQDNNDHTLFTTGYKCGSLPCPPYNDNIQVNCVVCSM